MKKIFFILLAVLSLTTHAFAFNERLTAEYTQYKLINGHYWRNISYKSRHMLLEGFKSGAIAPYNVFLTDEYKQSLIKYTEQLDEDDQIVEFNADIAVTILKTYIQATARQYFTFDSIKEEIYAIDEFYSSRTELIPVAFAYTYVSAKEFLKNNYFDSNQINQVLSEIEKTFEEYIEMSKDEEIYDYAIAATQKRLQGVKCSWIEKIIYKYRTYLYLKKNSKESNDEIKLCEHLIPMQKYLDKKGIKRVQKRLPENFTLKKAIFYDTDIYLEELAKERGLEGRIVRLDYSYGGVDSGAGVQCVEHHHAIVAKSKQFKNINNE